MATTDLEIRAINVARGSVVDEEALVWALQNGVIAAAGLDVFANEPRVPQGLLGLDNVVSQRTHIRSDHGQAKAVTQEKDAALYCLDAATGRAGPLAVRGAGPAPGVRRPGAGSAG